MKKRVKSAMNKPENPKNPEGDFSLETIGDNTDAAQNDSKLRPLPPAIRVTDAAQARRLLTRLITKLQRNEIDDTRAKTLVYTLSAFCQISAAAEFDERLRKLEQRKEEDDLEENQE